MSLETHDFMLGYLAAAIDIFESRVWYHLGNELNRLNGYIGLYQHANLISAILPIKIDPSTIISIFENLIKQGAINIEYRSVKMTYYGKELVVDSRYMEEAKQAKPIVLKTIDKWLQRTFSNTNFAATYYLAVMEIFPDNLLQTISPDEFNYISSSGLVGRWYIDETLGKPNRKNLMFKSDTPLRQLIDFALAKESVIKTSNEIKEKALEQLPPDQRQLLSVINRFQYLTVGKSIDQGYLHQSSSAQQTWNEYYSNIEITKNSILAIAAWDIGLAYSEIDNAFEKLLQKGYLIKVKHNVYSGIYREDVLPIIRTPDIGTPNVEVKTYLDNWLQEDITQIQFLEEILSLQKPNRLSVKESEIISFSRLTENLPLKEIPGVYIQTAEGVTINPSIRDELRDEIEKIKSDIVNNYYSRLSSLKKRYKEDPLYAIQEEPNKHHLRIYTPKASYLIMVEAWLNSKQAEEAKILASQVDHALLLIIHQKQIWIKEILKNLSVMPNLEIAFVSKQNILFNSTTKSAFEDIIQDILIDYRISIVDKISLTSDKLVAIGTKPEAVSKPPTPKPIAIPISNLPDTFSNMSSGKMLLGQVVSIENLNRIVCDTNLNRNQKREKLEAVGDFLLPIDVMATHTAIFGANQGGKTTTTKRIITELSKLNIPVLIIDWHSEYADLIKRLGGVILVPPTALVKPQEDEVALTWNILDPRFYALQINEAVLEDYIGLVVNMLSLKQIMDLSEPMKSAMTNALRNAYGQIDISKDEFPTFDDVRRSIEGLPIQTGTLDALIRRLNNMTTGTLGSIFCEQTSFNPSVLFNRNVCIKMNHLTEDFDYAVGLLTFFILRQAASYFKTLGEAFHDKPLRHVMVIDEAPAVLRSYGDIQKLLGRMLEELRKFGEGVIVVARNTDIPKIVLRETNQKIVHKLQLPQDIDSAAEMLGLKLQKNIITDLPPGVCFFKSAGDKSELVRIFRP